MIETPQVSFQPDLAVAPPGKVRDVMDFHLRWHEFRPLAVQLGRTPGLNDAQADTLAWMIELMDRIGPKDLEDGRS